ncbi:MAG: hypothetical protein ACXWUM_11685 [Burkholderiaceae bacterium]
MQERNRTNLARRRFSTGLCLGLLTAVAGCGGTDDAPTDAAPTGLPVSSTPKPNTLMTGSSTPKVATWDVAPTRAIAIPPGATFDIAATLPPTITPGGVFDVDPSGAPLPAGITLDRTGVLTVSSSAVGGTAGVVFRYTPPA